MLFLDAINGPLLLHIGWIRGTPPSASKTDIIHGSMAAQMEGPTGTNV